MVHYSLKDLKTEINMRGIQAKTIVNHKHATIKNLLLNAGESIPTHHMPVNVTFFVLEGTGKITIGETTYSVKPQDIVLCPINVGMSVQADDHSPLSFLNIKTPGI